MTINILHYDSDLFSSEEIKHIYNDIKEQLPCDTILIALPQGIEFEQYFINDNCFQGDIRNDLQY